MHYDPVWFCADIGEMLSFLSQPESDEFFLRVLGGYLHLNIMINTLSKWTNVNNLYGVSLKSMKNSFELNTVNLKFFFFLANL